MYNFDFSKLFFCFGTPKSGTTFLQMILNSHPEISCPSEHQLDFFIKELPILLQKYNKILEVVDKKTASQGASLFTGEDLDEIFKFIVIRAAIRGSQGKKVKYYGINDNAITLRLFAYSKLFPKAKFIFIIRDPRSVAVSSWYNNLRLEPNFLEDRGKNKEHWSKQVVKFWVRDINNFLSVSENNSNTFLMCRYEDLLLNPQESYKKLFDFLGVNSEDHIVFNVIDKTKFNKFKNGKFFRKASIDDWKEELSIEAIKNIEEIAVHLMKNLGYEPYVLKE